MAEVERIADAIERTVSGPEWHGPSLAELLKDMTPADALAHPIDGAHSIWELVLHLASWVNIARERLTFEPTREPTVAEDWPPVLKPTPTGWWRAVNELTDAHRRLAEEVRRVDEATLDRQIPGHDYSARVMLHGVVSHGAYHGGQIALLTRALENRP